MMDDECGMMNERGERRLRSSFRIPHSASIIPPRVTIMGLGGFGGGEGAARYLAERGARVTVTDLRSEAELAEPMGRLGDLAITYHLGEHPDADFAETDCVVVNPAVRPDSPCIELARRHGVRLDTAINLFLRACPAPVVGVTGSNGKSTTAKMTHEALLAAGRRSWLGGNIGGSLLPRLGEIKAGDVVVLELSSFQLARLPWGGRAPRVGVVLNVTPNHLDWHGTFEEYAAAKRNMVAMQGAGDTAALNLADEVAGSWADECSGAVFGVGGRGASECGAALTGDGVSLRLGERRAEVSFAELKLPGEHAAIDAACAASAAWLMGAPSEAIERALASFEPLPHRLETVAKKDGVRYVEDSVATTPEAAIAGMRAFDGPVYLIAGGSSKGTPFDAMGKAIADSVTAVALIGETAGEIEAAIPRRVGGGVEVIRAAGLREAFDALQRRAKPGSVILLSPGCASFGMFRNYVDRAEQFRALAPE